MFCWLFTWWYVTEFAADLKCKHCGGWCRWKGDGWKCGVCGHTYRV